MAEPLDLGQLSPTQQEALQQYMQVTDQELSNAVPLLQRSQWNLQIAIAKFFDGEGPDLVAEALAAQARASTSTARHEILQQGFSVSGSRSVRSAPSDPAPRIVPRQPVLWSTPVIIGLILSPFTLSYRIGSILVRAVTYLFFFLTRSLRLRPAARTEAQTGAGAGVDVQAATPPVTRTGGRKMLPPRDAASRFRREFDETYGASSLSFFDGGMADAYDFAKRELKFLLVILISPEHEDTDSFVRGTLLNPAVVAFIQDSAHNMIIWGGNVLDSEAYQAFQEYHCSKLPFLAVICLTSKRGGGGGQMGIVKRIAGCPSPAVFLADVAAAIDQNWYNLEAVRAERAEHALTRSLRLEQDSAYEQSLARDRERARQRREAAEAAAEIEQQLLEQAAAVTRQKACRDEWRRWRARVLTPEPPADGSINVVRVALKMPEQKGLGRVVRRFAASAKMEELYAFVECCDLLCDTAGPESEAEAKAEPPSNDYKHQYDFQILTVMPRAVHQPSTSVTIGEAIGRSGNLIVEDMSNETDDVK